jgi:DNA topoisomerase-3
MGIKTQKNRKREYEANQFKEELIEMVTNLTQKVINGKEKLLISKKNLLLKKKTKSKNRDYLEETQCPKCKSNN